MSEFKLVRFDPSMKDIDACFQEISEGGDLKVRMLEDYATAEVRIVARFKTLSLEETIKELRSIGIRVDEESGRAIVSQPILPRDYRKDYPNTFITIVGYRDQLDQKV